MPPIRLALLGLVLLQAAAVADELLPAPTGPHKPGRTSFHWQDDARDELETAAPLDKRELMVHLYYPADPAATGERAPYVPDADEMQGPWKPDQIERIKSMRAHSLENAALPTGNEKYPVVIFAPGGGMKGTTYNTLVEDLASHGWIVAAIDPPYNARGVRLPDGRVLGKLTPEERGWPEPKSPEEFRRFYRERIEHWSRDMSFVIDQLTVLNKNDSRFAGRLDLARGVGAVGHSRGGQAAGTVRILDERIRGGVNIDGVAEVYGFQPVKGEEESGRAPFLWIQKSLPPPPTEEQLQRIGRTRAEYEAEIARILGVWDKKLGAIEGGALRVYLDRPGIEHIDFSDEPFWDGRMTDEKRPGNLQTVADMRAWVRAFFDGTIRGEWEELKKLAAEPGSPREHVTVYTFGQMWPSQ
ncbi:MAG: hypothetical protein KF708_21100 [Pirellulales bacterium]|nr:hypothetical protein [Pirellulales bacterium]